MNKYSLSHTKWKCQYHIIFIPKYRQKVLYGKLRGDIREINMILVLKIFKKAITEKSICVICI